jgi:hypothetical protein
MHESLAAQHEWFAAVLRGHYGYYCRPHNYPALHGVYREVRRIWLHCLSADSDEVAQAYRYEVARGFRDDVAHLSDLISPSGEAFWPAGSLASVKPRGQSGIATSTCFSSSAVAVGMWATRLRCPSAAACPQRHGLRSFGRIAGFGAGSHR